MHIGSDSLLWQRAPVFGIAALCVLFSASMASAQVAVPARAKTSASALAVPSSIVPGITNGAAASGSVTGDQTPAGFGLRSQPLPSFQPIALDVGKFAFTAPSQTPASRSQPAERSFSFTPSRSMKGLSVGITARAAPAASPARSAVAAAAAATADAGRTTANSVDLALNYRGFQVTGGMSRSDGGVGGLSNETVNIGLGYAAGKVRTGITATAEREKRMFLSTPGPVEPRYGVEANGLFALSPSVSVGGTVRYRLAPSTPTLLDPNRDDRAVILGGAVAF